MKFTSIAEAMEKGRGKVSLRGWVYRERGSNQLKFIVLRDSTDIIQCVVRKESVKEDVWNAAVGLLVEESLEIQGKISKDERAPTGYEVEVSDLKVIGKNEEPFPITKDQSTEFLRDVRHLWVRSRKMTNIMKVRATVLEAFREYYRDNGYTEWTPPIMQPTQSEGGSTLFGVKYFNDTMYMTQSWQLYAEAGIMGVEKAFHIGPCFRAEKSKTTRHLSEFWMAEAEAVWMDLDGLVKDTEACVAFIVKQVVKKNSKELKELGQDVEKLKKIKAPFPKMTYTEVLKFLKKNEGLDINWGKDLRTVEEDKLSKHFDRPIIITHYPKEIMAFYKPVDPKNPKVALCLDMIAPEGYGEIIGGSQRDLDVDAMKKELKKMGEKPENYQWYFDTRKYGAVPHSGYGLGVGRVVAWLCGLDSIQDAIPFPRTMTRYKP